MFKIFFLILLHNVVGSYKKPHFKPDRNTIVHLFEWKWSDIANECENFLQPKGYAAVQISPPNENLIVRYRPWLERYQPVSYTLTTRSGNETDFMNMTRRCNNVGIRIYADAVINHMAGSSGLGTAGNIANATWKSFPGVPYGPNDFHKSCDDRRELRNCEIVGLKDLNQEKEYVRDKIVDFLNHLIDLGVAGFRIDAAQHIWHEDLEIIYSRLKNLNVEYGFSNKSRPFIYQEVKSMERSYIKLGTLVEFNYARLLSHAFRGNEKLKWLHSWGLSWGLIHSKDAVVFVDNHNSQREKNSPSLTYKTPKKYKMAIAFMLAHPYGITRVLSSYNFDTYDQGPPSMNNGNDIQSPAFDQNNTCTNGWMCEHRWQEIYKMVEFRNIVKGTNLQRWWTDGDQQIAFCRGNKGFILFTNWGHVKHFVNTCLVPGIYCDIISGGLLNGKCTGKNVTVLNDGRAYIKFGANELNGFLAIHIKSKLK